MKNTAYKTESFEPISSSVNMGYNENFIVSGKVLTDKNGVAQYKPHQVEIHNYFKLNGSATPENNAIVYLLETSDGKRGTLVYKYDAFKDATVFNFIWAVVEYSNRNRFTAEG
jgi:hypothetical protein